MSGCRETLSSPLCFLSSIHATSPFCFLKDASELYDPTWEAMTFVSPIMIRFFLSFFPRCRSSLSSIFLTNVWPLIVSVMAKTLCLARPQFIRMRSTTGSGFPKYMANRDNKTKKNSDGLEENIEFYSQYLFLDEAPWLLMHKYYIYKAIRYNWNIIGMYLLIKLIANVSTLNLNPLQSSIN